MKDFATITSNDNWFKKYPGKIAGVEFKTTSIHFPIQVKGTKDDVLRVTGMQKNVESTNIDKEKRLKLAKVKAKALALKLKLQPVKEEAPKQTKPGLKLDAYDLVIINSSGGKDSLCSVYELCRMADEQNYSRKNIIISHQDLGRFEWKGTKDLVKKQSDLFGLDMFVSKRRDKNGFEENLLEYVERRGKWMSNKQRYCTSDFKRAPGSRVVTAVTKDMGNIKMLYVFGFRKDESPARSKKIMLTVNDRLTTKKRLVHDYLPIHKWDLKRVWNTIKDNNLPYHYAYDLGMPRLSCVFCIFSPFDALVIAGIANPELLDEYVEVEAKIGHTFKNKSSIAEVKEAIESGYKPKIVEDWVM